MTDSPPPRKQHAEHIYTEHLVSQQTFSISLSLAIFPVAMAAAFSAWAQQVPDAGRVLQEQQAMPLSPHVPKANLPLPPTESAPKAAAGEQVRLQGVTFAGNTIFSDSLLQGALGLVKGQSLDLQGLQKLANQITLFYAQAGYPLSYAFLPAQNLSEGTLLIQIVEGRYGKIQIAGGDELVRDVEPFLAVLQRGNLIESMQLERTLRILSEQPGVTATSIMRSGLEPGTGDLEVQVKRGQASKGERGLDNHGNRFTGEYSLRGSLQWDSPFMLGDQITAQTTVSDEQLWFGSLGYSLPLGGSGLRGNASYAQTSYQLAKDFTSLEASGKAKIVSAGLSYPLLRTQDVNWTVAASYEHKKINDKRVAVGVNEHKSVEAFPIALQFDVRDRLAGGGISYGSISITHGKLNLDEGLRGIDSASGRNAQGYFNKLNVNAARLQATALNGVTLYGRIAAQWVNTNLDSSEKLSLGGPNGVRAYPVGEGLGDNGWLAQLEIRYVMGAITPFVFYDAGRVQLNAQPTNITPAVTHNNRSISGAGVGVRYSEGPWIADLAIAWQTHGGTPEADSARREPRFWVKAIYRF